MSKFSKSLKTPKGKRRVCTAYITKGGRRIYASSYGLKCFTFYVDK